MSRPDYALESTVDFKFTTRRFSTGAPFALASGVISAYPDNSTTQLTAGITLTADFDTVTGLNNVRVVATAANGYAAGSNYALVITTGTVDSVSVVGEVIGEFSLEAQSALKPTVAGRKLDVSAGGEAGLDWANIGSPTTAQNLSATNIDVDQIVASVSGAVGSVTGAVGSVTGAVGSVTGSVGSVTGAVGSVTGNVGGNVVGSVGSVTGLTAANLDATVSSRMATYVQPTGFLAATFPTDPADQSLIIAATDAIVAAIAALNNVSTAEVKTQMVAALATDTYAEPTGVPAATDDLATKLGYIYMALRNRIDVTATKKQFYDDGGAVEWEKDLSDDSVTYTETEGNAP